MDQLNKKYIKNGVNNLTINDDYNKKEENIKLNEYNEEYSEVEKIRIYFNKAIKKVGDENSCKIYLQMGKYYLWKGDKINAALNFKNSILSFSNSLHPCLLLDQKQILFLQYQICNLKIDFNFCGPSVSKLFSNIQKINKEEKLILKRLEGFLEQSSNYLKSKKISKRPIRFDDFEEFK